MGYSKHEMFTPNLSPLEDADEAEDVVAHLWRSDLTPDATQADGTGLGPWRPTATIRISRLTPVIPCGEKKQKNINRHETNRLLQLYILNIIQFSSKIQM